MRKFKHPVSMFMTKQDIEKGNLIERLKELGYRADQLLDLVCFSDNIDFLIYTNTEYGDVRFSTNSKIDKNHINFTNVDLFVALAAISEGERFYKGEIISYLNGSTRILTFSGFTNREGAFKCLEDKYQRDFSHFRKSTREEIINKFKPEKMVKKFQPKNGDIVEFSCNGFDYSKGEYIGALRKSGYIVFRLGTFTTLESGLIVAPFIREYNEPKKVTREEIAKLLGVDDFEIID